MLKRHTSFMEPQRFVPTEVVVDAVFIDPYGRQIRWVCNKCYRRYNYGEERWTYE